MLCQASHIRSFEAIGSDGSFGPLVDIYFDEYGWRVCYFVVDTGHLLSGKRSLAPRDCLKRVDWDNRQLIFHASQRELLDSASEEVPETVSRQLESHSAGYVAWPPVPQSVEGSAEQVPPAAPGAEGTDAKGRPLLRSVREVTGYAVEATDGRCGRVEDLLIDDQSWKVEYLVIDPRTILPGTLRMVPVHLVHRMDWLAHSVRMAIDKSQLRSCPTMDEAAERDRAVRDA